MIKNKRILVVGGAGSIGSELVRQLSEKNKIYVLDSNESALFDTIQPLKDKGLWVHGRVGDIRDRRTVEDVFQDFKPQYVFQAAAYKHVPLMEYTPEEAIKTNVMGHLNIVHVAKTWECVEKFVYISTDKAVNSTSVMGATKRLGEILTKNQGKGFIVVRFGNVMGSRGSLLPIWQKQVNEGKPLTVTHENMSRYFMTIPEAVNLTIEASQIGKGGETIILDMGRPQNVLQLAKQILGRVDKDVGIEMIGIREGETFDEKLMTEEEEKRAIKKDKFYIICQ